MGPARSQQSFFHRLFYSRLFISGAIIVLAMVTVAYGRAFYQDYTIKQEIASLEAEVRQLETKRLESMELLKYVSSDAFVEEAARTELNLKEQGETVVIVETSTVSTEIARSHASDQAVHLSNPAKWWYYMTHTSID